MKVIHLLVLGLIGFIVYRLTQSVQPPAPEPERGSRVQVIQAAAPAAGEPAPVRIVTNEAPRETTRDNRGETESLLKQILQRLAAAPPAAAPPAAAPLASSPVSPSQPAAAGGPPPPPMSPRERLRISQERRLALLKERGAPKLFKGIVRRHMDDDTLLVRSGEVGDCIVDEYVTSQGVADGAIVLFEAWQNGTQDYTTSDGEVRTALHLTFSAPRLPAWDQYGKPINRDVLTPDMVRAAGVHGETMLDRRK